MKQKSDDEFFRGRNMFVFSFI